LLVWFSPFLSHQGGVGFFRFVARGIMSLDGYYEGPGKNVMALFEYRWDYPTDESFDAYNAERLRAADTLLLGRTSYDGFRGFWPSVADDPNATPIQREISRLNNAIDKVVISDSLTSEETAPWHNTRIIGRAEAHEQITELKRQFGKDILVFGSRTLWRDLLAHDLVDDCSRRRHASIRRSAESFTSAHRNTQVGWLRERTRMVRSQPPKDVNLLAQCLLNRDYRGGTPRRPAQNR
jgi:dihydrofolate reductase